MSLQKNKKRIVADFRLDWFEKKIAPHTLNDFAPDEKRLLAVLLKARGIIVCSKDIASQVWSSGSGDLDTLAKDLKERLSATTGEFALIETGEYGYWLRHDPGQPLASTGYVYLMIAANGLYKIGRSRNIVRRLRGIQTSSPIPVELTHSVKTRSSNQLESNLHKVFSDRRSHGEWFKLTPMQVQQVKEIMNNHIKG